MKILVLSDSHGAVSPMEQAVEQTSPDLILHLGDCFWGSFSILICGPLRRAVRLQSGSGI